MMGNAFQAIYLIWKVLTEMYFKLNNDQLPHKKNNDFQKCIWGFKGNAFLDLKAINFKHFQATYLMGNAFQAIY